MTQDLRAAALESKAWPFEEARKLLARYPEGKPGGEAIVFETGYGPSGLPHIGTFNEVLRTTMVRQAFATLSDQPTRLIAFSDDMDGLRKVPDNVPNGDMLREHLGKPLSRIPDPFGTHESFAAHNNARLCAFLDRFGFDYEFVSSTDTYTCGRFDDALRGVLRHYQAILDVMLPTLGAERRATYSPVLPVSARSGRVLQVPVTVVDADAGLVAYDDEGERVEASILGGGAKLQWKVDWAMRWVALGVDYEMAGKDLIDSVVQSGRIARILGGRPPEGFNYELFLDERGEKISKTKGNGLSLDQWLTYGPEESLAFFAYREPRKAKQLHMGVIPRAVDEYLTSLKLYAQMPIENQLVNPVHHIRFSSSPTKAPPVTFGLLINVASLPGVVNRDTVWGFLNRYDSSLSPENDPFLDKLVGFALAYSREIVAPHLQRRPPNEQEAVALEHLDMMLAIFQQAKMPSEDESTELQNIVYEVGKEFFGKEALRDWFRALYETLLGSSQGPRMGSFFALYGVKNSRRLIAEALDQP